MNKEKCIIIYKKIFKKETFKKIIPYRSPSDGNDFKLERINPNHLGIIWGRPKGKNKCYIKFAKVFFQFCPIALVFIISTWINFYIHKTFTIMCDIGLLSMFLSFMLSALYYAILIFIEKRNQALIRAIKCQN